MRLVSFDPRPGSTAVAPGEYVPGLLSPGGHLVVDAARALSWWRPTNGMHPPRDPLAWFDLDAEWYHALARLHETLRVDDTLLDRLERAGCTTPLAACRLGGPVPRPRKIACVGLNYRDHAAEAKMAVPDAPVVFAKFATAVVGHGAPIVLPAGSSRVDYEAELAVVVGRRVRGVPRESARAAVLGYMNANDVSERDFQKRDGQWVRAKSCDTFAPMGPWIVTADDVANPDGLRIRLRLNGATMQDSNTDQFVFDVASLVAFLAETITLEPGDVILTGTPPGVGFARQPPVFLAPGDVAEVEIDGLGTLSNPVVAGD